MNTDQLSEEAIFRIGTVVSVDGRTIKIKVDKTKNSSHLLYKGELLKNISVGGYVKLVKGFTRIIGKVEGEFITEDRAFDKKHYGSDTEKINRVLSVSLLGFFRGESFERGIKELPLLDTECFLLHKEEFDQVHNFVNRNDDAIVVGTLALEKGQEIKLGVNSLFASHIGIFGNTGSGKSYTLAKIYRELFETYKDKTNFRRRAQFFIIDFNGEYSDSSKPNIIVDEEYKNIYCLSTRSAEGDKFPVPAETITDADFWAVFLEATEKTQTPFLRRAVDNPFVAPRIRDEGELKGLISGMILAATSEGERQQDRTVVFNLLKDLNDALGRNPSVEELLGDYRANLKFNSTTGNYYYGEGPNRIFGNLETFRSLVVEGKVRALRIDTSTIEPIDEIRLQIVIQYYEDIIRGFANKEHLAPLIKRLDKRIDDLKKVISVAENREAPDRPNITIISLRDVNMQMRKILPLLFCKKLYGDKKARADSDTYLNIIVDEAHNILSETSERESEQWKDYRLETFEEIIKEGRKFGVFLTIASQRPADISPTIISQLHNYFLHRLINNEDIRAVEKTISYLDKVSFSYLPILPTGTCIVAGLLASIPVVVDIGAICPKDCEPENKTITLTDKWL